MRNITTALFILLMAAYFVESSNAQQKMSERDLEGLKGIVRSVVEEFQDLQTTDSVDEISEKIEASQTFFDKAGQIERVFYKNSKYEIRFSMIDGHRIFSRTDGKNGNTNELYPQSDPIYAASIEKPEKLTKPDNRFQQRFAYEYDKNSRVIVERHFANNGKLIRLRKFKYDEKGRKIEMQQEELSSSAVYKFIYDENGSQTEMSEERRQKSNGALSHTRVQYASIKTDVHGNWTERSVTHTYTIKENKKIGMPADTFQRRSTEYRTIEYY